MLALPTELILEIISYLNKNDLKHLIFTNKEICDLLYSTEVIQFYQKEKVDLTKKSIRLKKSLFIFKTIYYSNSGKSEVLSDLLRTAKMNKLSKVVNFLTEHMIEIGMDDNNLLGCACDSGHLEVVKFLVNCGADVCFNNNHAVCEASYYGHLEIVKFLVSRGDATSYVKLDTFLLIIY